MKFKAGDYVRLAPPPGHQLGCCFVSLECWKAIFASNGGKLEVRDDVQITENRVNLLEKTRGPGYSSSWTIADNWVKSAELTVNKLGNFPRKKEEVEL